MQLKAEPFTASCRTLGSCALIYAFLCLWLFKILFHIYDCTLLGRNSRTSFVSSFTTSNLEQDQDIESL